MLKNKNIIVGVTGGIAAYKTCDIVSRLKRLNANVFVIMTKSATKFVAPLTFETLSKNSVAVDMFEKKARYDVEHISLAKKADAFLIAPASCDFVGKIANGICDDMLTTTLMATKAKVIICPSMNTGMYENPMFVENLNKLKGFGYIVFDSDNGLLACGDIGKGRLPSSEKIVEDFVKLLLPKQDFLGEKVLITAGGTRENIDRVRFITNYSSGKMGCELATAFMQRGAIVTLVTGAMTVQPPVGCEVIKVQSTQDMYEEVLKRVELSSIIIKAAAPADYKVKKPSSQKIKSATLSLDLTKNPDIAKAVGTMKGARKLVVFCAETEDLIENAKKKLVSKNADLIVANDVTMEGAGFDVDTNIVTILGKNDFRLDSGLQSKSAISHIILDCILKI